MDDSNAYNGDSTPMNLQQALLSQQLASAPSGQVNPKAGAIDGLGKLAQALLLSKLYNQSSDPNSAAISQTANNYGQSAVDQVNSMPIQPISLDD